MPNPQNPELRRSEESMRPRPELGPDPQDVGGEGGPVPPDNQPGHHPPEDQDKPPADKFAEALGIKSDAELGEEAEAEAPGRATKRRAAKKAPARKAAGKKAAAGPAAAPAASPRRGKAAKATKASSKPAAETPVSPAPEPATVPPAPAPAEPAEQAAEQHHHALPDEQLPHDAGMVTPSGTPVTARVLNLPMRYCGVLLRTGGGVIAAYGQAVRRLGERLTPGRR